MRSCIPVDIIVLVIIIIIYLSQGVLEYLASKIGINRSSLLNRIKRTVKKQEVLLFIIIIIINYTVCVVDWCG